MPARVPTTFEFDALKASVSDLVARVDVLTEGVTLQSSRIDALVSSLAGLRELVDAHDSSLASLAEASQMTLEVCARLKEASELHQGVLEGHAAELESHAMALSELEAAFSAHVDPGVDPDPDPDPEPVPTTMLVGSSLGRESGESYQQSFDRRTRTWGVEPEVYRYFYPGVPMTWPSFGSSVGVVSFKGQPEDILAGMHDTALHSFFRSVPADGKPHYWCYWHEPEDNFTTDVAQQRFRNAWLHVRAIAEMENTPGRNLQGGVILMAYTLTSASGRDVNDYLPLEGLDYIGFDAYGEIPRVTDSYQRIANVAERLGVPWLIGETAIPAGASDAATAAWIAVAAPRARELGCVAWCYFDTVHDGNDYRLSQPQELAAIAAEVRK